MTTMEIISMVENLFKENQYIAIRTQDGVEFPEAGSSMNHNSKQFESRDLFGEQDTEDAEELDGCSAWALVDQWEVKANAAEIIDNCTKYYDHCAILVSDSATYGMDDGEIVMSDAQVAFVIN